MRVHNDDQLVRFDAPDGAKICARRFGSSDPAARTVVLLHGLTHNSLVMRPLALWLAARYTDVQVLALDFRGRGLSEWAQPYMVETYGDDVHALLCHVGVERAFFIGTSLGGLVTMEVASRWPEKIAGALLNDIGTEIDPAGIMRIKKYAGTREDASFQDLPSAAAYFRSIYHECLPGFDAYEELAESLLREDLSLHYDPRVNLSKPDPAWAQLETKFEKLVLTQVPVVVLRGEISDILAVETVRKMAQDRPNVTPITIPGVGHAPMLNEPEALEAISKVLLK